jgi:3-deoxy-manno-octulosonate cytidylyltransferase (CMP-KDO synthetase)
MEVVAVIPARLASTRFPNKVLAKIGKKTLLQMVYEQIKSVGCVDKIYIATCDEEIISEARAFGAEAISTSKNHSSGTSRIAEAIRNISAEIILNVQADEPLISPLLLDKLVNKMKEDSEIKILTPVKKIEKPEEIYDPNVVKVVFDKDNYALYFSRQPIPTEGDRYKHIGVYCYRRDILLYYPRLEASPLEKQEKLEQLRFLWHGYKIKVEITDYESIGVDTPEDLEKVKELLGGET